MPDLGARLARCCVYVIRRFLTAIPTLFVIVTIAFFLIRVAPGGPFNQERGLNPVVKANLERSYGLDDPLWQQYLHYLERICCTAISGRATTCPISPSPSCSRKGLPISIQLGAAR